MSNISDKNEQKLSELMPALASRVRSLIQLAQSEGFVLEIVQGERTFAEQDALYAQGRAKPGKIVTNARGGQSYHNFGLAADLAFVVNSEVSWDASLYPHIGEWAQTVGLEWGGNWKKFKDLPHVQWGGLPPKPPVEFIDMFHRGGCAAVWAQVGKQPTPSSNIPPEAVLVQIGSKGDDVRLIQKRLADLHFLDHAEIDGIYGLITAKAVGAFQKAAAIPVDQIVGCQTRKKLFA